MASYSNDTFEKYSEFIIDYARKNYDKMFRQAGGYLKYKFFLKLASSRFCWASFAFR